MAERASRVDLQATVRHQRQAADPNASAWVAANAGSGKTHVLVMRLLRLLLAGTKPERILCLTFTKAAANEMSTRIFGRLGRWVTMDDAKLAGELADLTGRDATAEELMRARELFAEAMETPGGLKVQTIHAFCERVLQRFPLEAGVPPGFTVLDDDGKDRLLREATDRVLMRAVREPGGPLAEAHRQVIAFAAEAEFDRILREALSQRDAVMAFSREGSETVESVLRNALGVRKETSRHLLDRDMAAVATDAQLQRARDVLRAGSKQDCERGECAAEALAAKVPAHRIKALFELLLTKEGAPRARLVTQKTAQKTPDVLEFLTEAQDRFHRLHKERMGLVCLEASMALMRLACETRGLYEAAKQHRSALDFDDLIRHTADLLDLTQAADWVLYKLDGGLDHILVDEAQDTSADQWRLINALADEFFRGAGTREEQSPRTLFAVGDEKQSIYGFQGAAPHLFEKQQEKFRELAQNAGLAWAKIPMSLSFRTVAPILGLVDRVFVDESATPGVSNPEGHSSNRPGQAGLVEVWDVERPEDAAPSAIWSPDGDRDVAPPSVRLANRIADTIKRWLDTGERLASEDRPIRPSDILILVRKRQPLAPAMVAALEARRIPVAGADRIKLANELAIQDLLVLGDFLLLPEDDLALATVLKGPLIGLDDTALIDIAPSRRGTLWSALLRKADTNPRYAEAAELLKRWRRRADLLPPFELLVQILDQDGMRERLLTRLGAEAADAIDELLALAIAFDDSEPPSLQGFIHWLRSTDHVIKRDMEHGRDQVRVMTVHGAKGLEAPIVFLPDTCSSGAGRAKSLLTLDGQSLPLGMPSPLLWRPKGAGALDAIRAASVRVRDREAEEHNRLLYVAMTRPRDRLYIAGFEGKRARPSACWYDHMTTAMATSAITMTEASGRTLRRIEAAQTVPVKPPEPSTDMQADLVALPDWAQHPARTEAARLVPIAPSRLAPLDFDGDGDPVEAKSRNPADLRAPSPLAETGEGRFLRGTLTHALLQHLPTLDVDDRAEAARRFIAVRGKGLADPVQDSILTETLAVLTDPQFADLFAPDSRAETPIVAEISPPGGKGAAIRIAGQIDRLVRLSDRVLIVDYKTNRPPPTEILDVPEAYLLQLAAYRLAVAQIFSGLPVEAYLLWTDGPRMMNIPRDMLDAAEGRLFVGDVMMPSTTPG